MTHSIVTSGLMSTTMIQTLPCYPCLNELGPPEMFSSLVSSKSFLVYGVAPESENMDIVDKLEDTFRRAFKAAARPYELVSRWLVNTAQVINRLSRSLRSRVYYSLAVSVKTYFRTLRSYSGR